MTASTAPSTPEERIAELEKTVAALKADFGDLAISGGYPAAPAGFHWVPYFEKFWLGAFVILGLVAGSIGAWIFTASLSPVEGAVWDPTRLTNVYLMDIGLLFAGFGLALVLGEVMRLEANPVVHQGVAVNTGGAKDLIDGSLALFKGLTAGRLVLAVGFVLLLSNAYLAKS